LRSFWDIAVSAFDDISQDDTYITVAEAAELLDITENAVRKRIHRNSLPATKEGRDWRIRIADLEADRIIDVHSEPSQHEADRPATGHVTQQDGVQHDTESDGSVRDIPQQDSRPPDGMDWDGTQEASPQRDIPHGDTEHDSPPDSGLQLAERQLAIFVDQFVRPKDMRIAELERQIGRLEAETEILAEERDNVRKLERENGELSERLRQLHEELIHQDDTDDPQRDTKPWWKFWH